MLLLYFKDTLSFLMLVLNGGLYFKVHSPYILLLVLWTLPEIKV